MVFLWVQWKCVTYLHLDHWKGVKYTNNNLRTLNKHVYTQNHISTFKLVNIKRKITDRSVVCFRRVFTPFKWLPGKSFLMVKFWYILLVQSWNIFRKNEKKKKSVFLKKKVKVYHWQKNLQKWVFQDSTRTDVWQVFPDHLTLTTGCHSPNVRYLICLHNQPQGVPCSYLLCWYDFIYSKTNPKKKKKEKKSTAYHNWHLIKDEENNTFAREGSVACSTPWPIKFNNLQQHRPPPSPKYRPAVLDS